METRAVNEKKFQKPLDVFSLIDTMDIIYVKNFNNVRLFGDKKKLVSGDNEVFLTDIEFKILDVLFDVGKDGIYVDELVCSVFCKNTESNLKTLSTHIYNLKKKLLNISLHSTISSCTSAGISANSVPACLS